MVLRHRDKELLRFDWVGDARVRIVAVNDAERRFLPIDFGKERFDCADDALRHPLEDWLVSRSSPVGRYELAKHKGRLCSKCKLFTSDRYGYLPVSKLPGRDVILDDVRFREMFLFDALIYNVDRHLGNFGYLVDNDTNEIVDVAPIFDNGYGLMPHLDVSARSAENDYYAIRNYLRDKHPALFRGWMDFPYELTEELLSRLEALEKFRFKKQRHYNWSDERCAVLSGFLQKRADDIRRFGRKAGLKRRGSDKVGEWYF